LKTDVQVQLNVDSAVTTSTLIQDIQKYAGFDIGAVYAPGIDELRKFMTVNIYWGAVDATPTTVEKIAYRQFWLSRTSLTLGKSLGDLSAMIIRA